MDEINQEIGAQKPIFSESSDESWLFILILIFLASSDWSNDSSKN